ncbi:MAG: hypothetical protein AAFY26_23975, partial [Cyanobacteria bacterium J06638_22]
SASVRLCFSNQKYVNRPGTSGRLRQGWKDFDLFSTCISKQRCHPELPEPVKKHHKTSEGYQVANQRVVQCLISLPAGRQASVRPPAGGLSQDDSNENTQRKSHDTKPNL